MDISSTHWQQKYAETRIYIYIQKAFRVKVLLPADYYSRICIPGLLDPSQHKKSKDSMFLDSRRKCHEFPAQGLTATVPQNHLPAHSQTANKGLNECSLQIWCHLQSRRQNTAVLPTESMSRKLPHVHFLKFSRQHAGQASFEQTGTTSVLKK